MEPENRRETILGVRVELQDWNQDQGQAELMAYAFGPNGKLVATAPLYLEDEGSSMGLAKLALEIESPEEICIKVGPPVENPKLLARHQPAVESLVVEPGVQGVLEMQLPPEAWGCWVRFAYLVTGTVRKSEEGPNPPICSGEVEIYDVDPAYCLLRLPDPVIEKLQGAMVDLLLDPPPFDLPEIPRLWPELREEKLPIQPPEPPKESEIRERLEQLPGD